MLSDSSRLKAEAGCPIASSRLLLRPPVRSDASEVFAAVIESRRELGRWLDWCREGYSLADAVEWAESSDLRSQKDGPINWVILNPQDPGRILGCVGLSSIDLSHKRANLGYWIRTSETGNGYASEAARVVVEFAFERLGFRTIEIAVHPDNTRSSDVARALDAVDCGVVPARIRLRAALVEARLYLLTRPAE